MRDITNQREIRNEFLEQEHGIPPQSLPSAYPIDLSVKKSSGGRGL
jgi:hypothetical protein